MAEQRADGDYNYKTLLCTNIPELFLDKFVARSHFGRFGNLVNFVLRPRRMTCTVSYASEAEAAQALLEGNVYNGHEFEMSYAELETTPAQKTEEWVDPDVQAELSALSAAGWRSEYAAGKIVPVKGNVDRDRERERERERQRAPSQFKAAKAELELILRKPAQSSEDKYRILDARDKLLRLNQRRENAPDNEQRLQGYCPDMCPEKERWLREFQRQVAIFELQDDSDEHICHELALKQYSRSSADQETPLPHELRAESALHMTMNYLMHEIMDISEQEDVNLGDWFHFVWDRTRSIRKEITQQELCSLGSVRLVEQCARFHIHCAARLVAEDPSIFDSKINAENLTKCLQTLKYMYHDLRLKGVQCPREAEFRGYIVLLNLADANFLWDIGQLPVELQNCAHVRRAIQFYLALQDTNFVRFFKLLREPETSYLDACILVTYFTRLRILALHRIVQAYRAPRKYEFSSLPVSYIRKMLVLSNDSEAVDLLECCGLNINESERVELTRIHAPEHYKLRRQIELVESKRQHSVGECICGETLPPKSLYTSHVPHNSFNEMGYLKSSAWAARDQLPNSGELELEAEMTMEATTEGEGKTIKESSNDKDINRITGTKPTATTLDNIFKVPQLTAPVSPKIKAATSASQTNQNGFSFGQVQEAPSFGGNHFEPKLIGGFSFASAVKPQFTLAAAEATEQQRLQRAATEEAKLAALEQAIAAAKQRENEILYLQKTKAEQAERLRQQRKLEQQHKQDRQRREQLAAKAAAAAAAAEEEAQRQRLERQLAERETYCQKLLLELLHEELFNICGQEWALHRQTLQLYDSMLEQQVQDLVQQQLMHANYELCLMRQYWQRWRSYRRIQKQKDSLVACLPLSFGGDSSTKLLDIKSAEHPLRLMRRYRQGESCDYHQLLSSGLLEDQCWLKLDLWELLAKTLPQPTPGARLYYKLLVSLPANTIGYVMEHALDRGLLHQPVQSENQHPNSSAATSYINGVAHGVALCVHKMKGLPERRSLRQLEHADGIVCYADANQLQEARQRLQLICQHSGCSNVALIVQHQTETPPQQQQLQMELQLNQLRSFCILSCPTLKQGKQKLQLVALLQCAIEFLARQPHRSRSSLEQQELREWLLSQLGDELFCRLRYAAAQDVWLDRSMRESPEYCGRLYNEAVRRLQLVAGEKLNDWPQLPEELREYVQPLTEETPLPNRLEYFIPGWQEHGTRSQVVLLLEQIKLPPMQPLPREQHEICEWLLNYTQLSQEENVVEAVALRAIQTLELQQRLGILNYLEIVEIFATERLQYIIRHQTPEVPLAIVYRHHTMHKYYGSHWFYDWQAPRNGAAGTELAAEEKVPEELQKRKPKRQQEETEELSFEQVLRQAQNVLDKCQQHTIKRKTLTDLNGSLNNFEHTMQRFERNAISDTQQKDQLQQQHQKELETENTPIPAPALKRQRLTLPSDQSSLLVNRTERIINGIQNTEQQSLQALQHAKKFF